MELKRIIARDSRSANEKAIQLYGNDVLIISSQRVEQQTELIVAVDVGSDPLAAATPALLPPGHRPDSIPSYSSPSLKTPDEPSVPFAAVFQTASAPVAQDQPAEDSDHTAFDNALEGVSVRQEARMLAAPLDDPNPTAEPQSLVPQDLQAATPTLVQPVQHGLQAAKATPCEQLHCHGMVDMLREEMAALRREFVLSRQIQPVQPVQPGQPSSGLSPELQKLSLALQEVAMPAGLRALISKSLQELNTLDQAWPVLQRLLVQAMDRPVMEAPNQGVHAVCGPTGAGKTSMLARLACAAAQSHGAEKQVMVSYGDQRLGAWSQMQLLASEAGVACFRAADLAMLQTLLDDLQGKTVWIDTPGADFSAQALEFQSSLSLQLHAVLPVDATVTSVQKILQNPQIRWSSLILTKLDEAAYPWPLIKGLCEQPLAVSCMAEDSKIKVPAVAFDTTRLMALAMTPLQALLAEPQPLSDCGPSAKIARKPRAKKAAVSVAEIQAKPPADKPRATTMSLAKAVHG
jgi:flagellar biosynthesis GTPase FlhF